MICISGAKIQLSFHISKYILIFLFFCTFICTVQKKVVSLRRFWEIGPLKHRNMNAFLKILGVVLVLIGVVCLVVYRFALPQNWLLVCSLVLEFIGILSYIIINRKLD